MKLRFKAPAVETTVRFFASEASFSKAVKARRGLCVWDSGAAKPKALAAQIFPGGEAGKNWQELGKILGLLAQSRMERSAPLVVVGGGAIMDLGAMAASLYRRGVPLVLAPTTLLGMVDASVGGKTAVDFHAPEGILKNFAGTFYPAREVWISPHFLRTLSRAERLSGAGEAWKTLWIAGIIKEGKALRDFVNTGVVGPKLTTLIRKCLELKIRVVTQDPLDTLRKREILNFGHTVGHALEASGELAHGEAVLWGMAVEISLLGKRGELMLAEVLRVLRELELPVPKAFLRSENHCSLLLTDKKIKAGKIELSVLSAPGKIVKLKRSPNEIADAIKVFPEFFRHASAHLRA